MITDSLQAWVIHKRDSGNTSANVTFFTREKGLVTALCKGGRTPKKLSLLQPFTPLYLTLDARYDWHYVGQLESASFSLVLVGSNLFAGLYVNELIVHSLHELDVCPEFYDVYVHTLQALTNVTERKGLETVLRRFELQLLNFCGYQIPFECEIQTNLPILSDKHYSFIPGEGFRLSPTGILGSCIIAVADDNFEDALTLKAAKMIMRCALDHALDGKQIKTRSLFNNLNNTRAC